MKKTVRTSIQLLILAVAAVSLWKFVTTKDLAPDLDRTLWTQREGFTAISFGGIAHDLADRDPFSIERVSAHLLSLLPGHEAPPPRKANVTEDTLRQYLDMLVAAGFTPVTTQDLLNFYKENAPLPERAVYLMFEGGRKDSLVFSHPLLNERRLNANLFVYTDKTRGRDRFFLQREDLEKVGRNVLWDIGSMGDHSGLINQQDGQGGAHYLEDVLRDPDGKAVETPEAFRARVFADFETSSKVIAETTGKPPLAYIFMPANTLDQSLPPVISEANNEALSAFYPLAFTRVGESFNSRDENPRALGRLLVHPGTSPEELLQQLEASLPLQPGKPIPLPGGERTWLVVFGDLRILPGTVALTNPPDKNGFALVRGSENLRNLICDFIAFPSPDGASFVYLRYQNPQSYVRIQIRHDRILVQESAETGLNTLIDYRFQVRPSEVRLSAILKGNRLLLKVNGSPASDYPAPLTPVTDRGGFGVGSDGSGQSYDALFKDFTLRPMPSVWQEIANAAALGEGSEETVSGAILPQSAFPGGYPNAATLLSLAVKGIAPNVALSSGGQTAMREFVARRNSSATAAGLAHLVKGVVLPCNGNESTADLKAAIALARENGLRVALRAKAEALPNLARDIRDLAPDRLLLDVSDNNGDHTLVTLKNRFDKASMMFRPADQSGTLATFVASVRE